MHPPKIAKYLRIGSTLIPAVSPTNPNYKKQVREFIYDYVEEIVGENRAPKIATMLIDLDIDVIKAYLQNYDKLYIKTEECLQNLL